MTTIRKIHRKPFQERKDIQIRLNALKRLIESLRDCDLPEDSKKRMLNHAVWEVTVARGNFAPEFRSKGVIEGEVGTKIEREHVYTRKRIVADILFKREPLDSVLLRIIHCVVTKEEHAKLKAVLRTEDGWSRYHEAGVVVYRFDKQTPERFTEG